MIIRKLNEKDSEAYKLLFDEAYREYLDSLRYSNPEQYRKEKCEMRSVSHEQFDFYRKTRSSFVAQEKDRVVGYVATQTIDFMRGLDKTLWIEYIVTKREYRKHGIATALLKKLKDYAKQHQIDTIYATINPDNVASIKLHQKLGFNVKNWITASLHTKP